MYNMQTTTVMESVNVVVDDSGVSESVSDEDKELILTPSILQANDSNCGTNDKEPQPTSNIEIPKSNSLLDSNDMCSKETHGASSSNVFVHPRSQKGQVIKDHPLDKVIGDVTAPLKT